MTASFSSLVGLLFLLLVFLLTDSAAAQVPSASPGGVTSPAASTSPTPSKRGKGEDGPVDLRTFVTTLHIHGLPYAEAHAYGPQAVPELVAMLKDPSLEPYWTNIVATLGCIEDASAVQPLMDFMKRQRGEISADAFRRPR